MQSVAVDQTPAPVLRVFEEALPSFLKALEPGEPLQATAFER